MLAATVSSAQQLNVFVKIPTAPKDAFVDLALQDRIDASKDVRGDLGRRPEFIAIVKTEPEADVTIEVLTRTDENTDVATREKLFGTMVNPDRTKIKAVLKVGTYTQELEGDSIDLKREAAHQLGNKIEQWIKLNRAQIWKQKGRESREH